MVRAILAVDVGASRSERTTAYCIAVSDGLGRLDRVLHLGTANVPAGGMRGFLQESIVPLLQDLGTMHVAYEQMNVRSYGNNRNSRYFTNYAVINNQVALGQFFRNRGDVVQALAPTQKAAMLPAGVQRSQRKAAAVVQARSMLLALGDESNVQVFDGLGKHKHDAADALLMAAYVAREEAV